jgi:hypothetical protein
MFKLTVLTCSFSSESDHLTCRVDLPEGCPCCFTKTPAICCELCTPTHFEGFARVDIEKKAAAPSRSRIKDYVAGVSDFSLRDTLHTFRREQTALKWGTAALRDLGPGLFMSDAVLQCIVDCAHDRKIDSQGTLAKETHWPNTLSHGNQIVAIISLHCPKPIPPPLMISKTLQSVQPCAIPLQSLGPSRSTKARKCSRCGSLSHICTFALLIP